MDSVLRALFIYFVLMILFHAAGKRAISQTDTFDFVVLLIISEATQQAMMGQDPSLTNSFLVVMTLVGMSVIMSFLKARSSKLEKALQGGPLIVVQDGRPLPERMIMSRLDEEDILQAARDKQGLERMGQIKYAVLEESGEISIIPKKEGG